MTLKATTVGWYGSSDAYVFDPVSNRFDRKSCSKAVCFTESTLAGLRAHREVFSTKYGVAFDRDFLFEKGANPCLNIRENIFKKKIEIEKIDRHLYNFIPIDLHPYVNIISESFDATHEREWRYPGDLTFVSEDILFVFCPECDFPEFTYTQKDGKPVLFDLNWLDRI